MPNYNSQEHTIYRNLAGKIQMGFYDSSVSFPSIMDIARQFQVSYCPVQRALKMLEKEGLIRPHRGQTTVILAKPYENYLESDVFKQRSKALLDLCKGLQLISPSLSFHSYIMGNSIEPRLPNMSVDKPDFNLGRFLYNQFENSIYMLGSQTALSLYYDISAFAGSALLDILNLKHSCNDVCITLQSVITNYQEYTNDSISTREPFEELSKCFFKDIEEYLLQVPSSSDMAASESFRWEPYKGRTRYCDVIAIDLLCKINQGIYPIGTKLPNSAVLADIYHVSEMTMRRTISLLNKMGVTKTTNGIGTHICSQGGADIPHKLKELSMDDNLRSFLEALQLLALISEPVMLYTFRYIPAKCLEEISNAASITAEKTSMVTTISRLLRAVVCYCPLESIREVFCRLTLLIVKGSILRLEETGMELVPGWSDISADIIKGCQNKDNALMAQASRRIFETNFTSSQKTLIEIGVDGVEQIAGFH